MVTLDLPCQAAKCLSAGADALAALTVLCGPIMVEDALPAAVQSCNIREGGANRAQAEIFRLGAAGAVFARLPSAPLID